MKPLQIICLGMLIVSFIGCRKSLYDSEYHKMDYDGEKRTYLVHVPPSYSDETPTSLVIALHGGVGSAKNVEEQSGLAEFSDEAGFILCSPNGVKRAWNAGWCCGDAAESDVDDVGFISALIDEMLNTYNIFPNRVYVTGMSNGAFMSYRLACELSDKIAAIAPVAGTMNFKPCIPSSSVSIIHFHSYEDSNVPYLGGVGDGISDHYNTPLDSVFNAWSNLYGCGSDTSYQTSDQVDFQSWYNCADSIEIQLYMSKDGGHSWPMGVKPTRKADEPSQSIDANAIMWDFFLTHAKKV